MYDPQRRAPVEFLPTIPRSQSGLMPGTTMSSGADGDKAVYYDAHEGLTPSVERPESQDVSLLPTPSTGPTFPGAYSVHRDGTAERSADLGEGSKAINPAGHGTKEPAPYFPLDQPSIYNDTQSNMSAPAPTTAPVPFAEPARTSVDNGPTTVPPQAPAAAEPTTTAAPPPVAATTEPPATKAPQVATAAPTQGTQATAPVSLISGDQSNNERAAAANSVLTDEERAKIVKAEKKDSARLSKIIKAEAKANDQSLAKAMRELANLQKTQKKTSKDEHSALQSHEKAISKEQKTQKAMLKAQSVHDKATADINIAKERLDAIKLRAAQATEQLHNQQKEVESLRVEKAVADRERAAKIKELHASEGMLSSSNTMTGSGNGSTGADKPQKGVFGTLKKRRA